jgi:hypothetical protein
MYNEVLYAWFIVIFKRAVRNNAQRTVLNNFSHVLLYPDNLFFLMFYCVINLNKYIDI